MEVQERIIFLLIVIVSSGAEEVKNLTGTEGGSITLPDSVMEQGFLSFGGTIVAMVTERKCQTFVHKNKVLWNNNTGLFTITRLQRSDSGIYHIDSKTGKFFTRTYRITVYEAVPTPAVITLNVSAESCTLLCFVEKAEETTLLWYRDEDKVNQSSVALSLPLTVHQQDFSSSYRCVAANPAEQKTLLVNVVISCGGQNKTDTSQSHMAKVVIPIVTTLVVILVVIVVAFVFKCLNKSKRPTNQTQEEQTALSRDDVQYTDILVSEDRHNQTDPSGPADHSNLRTVYDKLEVHRMAPITSDHC
uniref:uncharacterized protein LOC124065564 isoform X2 n=1 Tax=Scatophagus argus TaxID=75038 RepID=UPI001ED84FB8|nr:uncharacterized protein LOC124065564 isoform X2 [Scatophagus argus]XP_046257003.1 uncharacterized protein LOC124065564 isoform X2 [Scatophagus argus]